MAGTPADSEVEVSAILGVCLNTGTSNQWNSRRVDVSLLPEGRNAWDKPVRARGAERFLGFCLRTVSSCEFSSRPLEDIPSASCLGVLSGDL